MSFINHYSNVENLMSANYFTANYFYRHKGSMNNTRNYGLTIYTTEQRASAKLYDNFSAIRRILDENLSLGH